MNSSRSLDAAGVKSAISGNLCRCTGYRSIKEAGQQVVDQLSSKLSKGNRIQQLCEYGALPDYFKDIAGRLAALVSPETRERIQQGSRPLVIGGGTDLYVQRGEDIPDQPVELLNTEGPVRPVVEDLGRVIVDARMSFQAFGDDPIVQKSIPDIQAYNELIASWPIRTRATLGGNLCNASPIADMTCLLLALDAQIHLEGGAEPRSLALKDFFLGYKQLAKTKAEVIASISFFRSGPGTLVNWEKVSKRRVLDI